ncbi:uncharacterized protein LOC143767889 [Ranitomeya variabilis]|uniref:uncharacterized protein LOC143767889 n=1 Tax=Ranitomeya variabilis TaxID=490064 RepID=UPI0040570638
MTSDVFKKSKSLLVPIYFLISNSKDHYFKYFSFFISRFKVPGISSQLIRRVCETSTLSKFSDSEKCLFARYLSHTNLTAERSYREKTLTDICHGHELVTQTGLYNSDEPIASTSRNQDTIVTQRRHDDSNRPQAATSRNQDAAVVETTDESQEEDEDATDKEESSHQSGQEEESESDINSETYISSAKKSSHDTVRRSTRQRQTGLQTSTRAVKRKEIISKEKKDSCPTHKLMSKEEHFKRFTKKYPITLEKDVPSPSICREESRTNWRYFGDRWRKIQNKMRVDHITGMLQKSNVKISEVERHIENQGWKRNLPRVTDILHQLKK